MPEQILVIDDEPMVARAMTLRLRAAGYDVLTAANGRDGIEAASAAEPDLILLDIQMPDLDGFEVNRQLKANAELAAIPVVFVSAHAREASRQAAIAAGAAAFFSKPYEASDLLETIARVLDGRRSAAPPPNDLKGATSP